MLLQAINQEN
jgi:hypothetical protein